MATRTGRRVKDILVFLLLALLTVTFLYPVFFMLVNSLKARAEYFTSPFSMPAAIQFENYSTMISQFQILKLFRNSFIVSAGSVILLLVVCTFASYVFAKYRFKGRNVIYLAVLVTMFIPSQVTIIPLYLLFSRIGVTGRQKGRVHAGQRDQLTEQFLGAGHGEARTSAPAEELALGGAVSVRPCRNVRKRAAPARRIVRGSRGDVRAPRFHAAHPSACRNPGRSRGARGSRGPSNAGRR